MASQAGMRALSPGRVVVLSNKMHRNSVGIILQQTSLQQRTSLSKDPLDKLFTVLVAASSCSVNYIATEELKLSADDKVTEPIISRRLAVFDDGFTQKVEVIRASDIAFIAAKQIKIDPSKIIDDHKKRQIPRFR